jgi:hypothetical protein
MCRIAIPCAWAAVNAVRNAWLRFPEGRSGTSPGTSSTAAQIRTRGTPSAFPLSSSPIAAPAGDDVNSTSNTGSARTNRTRSMAPRTSRNHGQRLPGQSLVRLRDRRKLLALLNRELVSLIVVDCAATRRDDETDCLSCPTNCVLFATRAPYAGCPTCACRGGFFSAACNRCTARARCPRSGGLRRRSVERRRPPGRFLADRAAARGARASLLHRASDGSRAATFRTGRSRHWERFVGSRRR